jgi:HNH endonuclease
VQSGVHDALPDGSAPLFVPDMTDRTAEYRVTIEWRGQAYENNELKFSGQAIESTSRSWRFLLRGTSSTGASLTQEARENFQHKLLVWFELAPLHFRLEAFGKDEIDGFIASGVADQGRAGSAATGKWFGVLELTPRTSENGPLESEIEAAAENISFDPASVEDGRRLIARTIAERLGQPSFRRAVLAAYGERCCVTDCDVAEALEAAHITPYRGEATNRVDNALLLRADIHNLFDRGFISIAPDEDGVLRVQIGPALRSSVYSALEGTEVNIPEGASARPSLEALRAHFEQSTCN